MKISISVPDDLWSRAAAAASTSSPSAVVQEALSAWVVGNDQQDGYRVRPAFNAAQEAVLARVLSRLAAEAVAAFQDGYTKGLELASQLRLQQLAWLVKLGISSAARMVCEVERDIAMNQGPHNASGAIVASEVLAPAIGSMADFTGGDGHIPSVEYLDGVDAALKDIYHQARREREP